jgi:hypothetical protein
MAVSSKAAVWGERLRRHERSGLTVAEFCERECVSVPSFYQWKRRLAQPPLQPTVARRGKKTVPAFQRLTLRPSGVVALEWTRGVRMTLPAENLPLIRAVVAELLQAEHAGAGHARSRGGELC